MSETKQRKLVIQVPGEYGVPGAISPGIGTHFYPQGSKVTIKVNPNPGFTVHCFQVSFWEVVDGQVKDIRTETYTGRNEITLTLDYDCTVHIIFEKLKPKPTEPCDVELVDYKWEKEERGTFPFTYTDVRPAWKLTYTVKNKGAAGSYERVIWLNNAPIYIENPIAVTYWQPIGDYETQTLSIVLPEPKGSEYYTLILKSATTRTYTLKSPLEIVPPSPVPTPTPPPKEEVPAPAPPAPTPPKEISAAAPAPEKPKKRTVVKKHELVKQEVTIPFVMVEEGIEKPKEGIIKIGFLTPTIVKTGKEKEEEKKKKMIIGGGT